MTSILKQVQDVLGQKPETEKVKPKRFWKKKQPPPEVPEEPIEEEAIV